MRFLPRAARTLALVSAFGLATHFALEYGSGGLWRGLRSAHAVVGGEVEVPYDLTRLRAISATLDTIRKRYVEPERVNPRQMLLSALDQVQMEVAPVIVTHDEKSPTVKVRVFEQEQSFRVDNVQGHWDVAARLREIFAFIQEPLRKAGVKLDQVEYAAANGMLRTLDPHSVFLSPESYRDMNVSTSGHFGGLGIVISIRDQELTVMRPMPGTPAGRAGLKRFDRITKINNESTLNMPLEDAVERLRGDAGSKVTVWVHRDGPQGWSGSRPFELTREVIRVDSVEHEKLEGGVGYVRIKQFQATTASELSSALKELRGAGALNSLVLDLRDNPGGLLDQAGKVADLFIEDGTLYATVGSSEGRNEARAARAGTEPNYPIVVLVNGNSASASEIVTGALKNQNRAVVLGETTFGKGSVQLVFPEVTPEGAALKLTIAQYLTPGDISIQGTGVIPDIELDPMTVDALEMNLFRDEGSIKERDLKRTLGAGGRRQKEPPTYVLRYDLPQSVREEIRDRGAAVDDEFRVDAPIRIARELAAAMKSGERQGQLKQLGSLVESLQKKEEQSIAQELKGLSVDWSAPPADHKGGPLASELEVKVSTDRPGDTAVAGEPLTLQVEVTNHGKAPVYQLSARTQSDAGYYDERELIFGKLAPGETRKASAPFGYCQVPGRRGLSTKPLDKTVRRECKLPKDAVSRQDVVRLKFQAAGSDAPKETELRPTVKSLPRPNFAYSYQVVDNRSANQNGRLERGEGATVYLRVKNVGEGASFETQANLSNLSGDGLLLNAGRFDISNMKPGEEREVEFTFDLLPTLKEPEVKLSLSVVDADLRVVVSEKLLLQVGESAKQTVSAEPGVVKAKQELALYDQAAERGTKLGSLPAGSLAKRLGKTGAYTQLELAPGRFAFALSSALEDASGTPAAKLGFQAELGRSPPALELAATELATRGESVRLTANAKDSSGGVQDMLVFVGNRKLYYQPNPKKKGEQMSLAVDVPLKPGMNVINVVARENDDTQTRKTIVVRKDGASGEALPTPKQDEFGEGWEFGE